MVVLYCIIKTVANSRHIVLDFHHGICYYNQVIYEAEAIRHSPDIEKYEVIYRELYSDGVCHPFFISPGGERY